VEARFPRRTQIPSTNGHGPQGTGLESLATVTNFLAFVFVIGGAAWYFMTKEERAKCVATASQGVRSVKDAVLLEGLSCADFANALRARTPRLIAAPLLIVLSTVLTLLVWLSSPSPVPGWGDMLLSTFVHPTLLGMILGSACLLQIALILERLVGWRVFGVVYVSAAVAAGIVGLTSSSAIPNVGAAGSVLAMYGLLLVTSLTGMFRRSELQIPRSVAIRLAAVGVTFSIWMLITFGFAHLPVLVALATGVTAGLAVAREVHQRTPPLARLSRCLAMVVITAAIYAGGVALQPRQEALDVRPEIDRVIAIEKQTAALYDHAVERFKKGRIPAAALAELIEDTIEPRLRLVAKRLRSLQDVPPEDQPRVTTAAEFLALRDESWRLRAQALQRSDMAGLRQADAKEQVSLATLDRIR